MLSKRKLSDLICHAGCDILKREDFPEKRGQGMKSALYRHISVAFTLAALIIISAVMLAFSYKTPLYKDDYSYSYTFAVKENKFPIENFSQVIESQINHYKVMNGRAVVHTLLQTFLMWGKETYNYIGAVAFAFFCLLISRLGAGRNSAFGTLISFVCLWLLTPRFGESFLWVSGACNYLFGPLIAFSYLIPGFRALEGRSGYRLNVKIILAPLWFIWGVAAGMTCENASAALLVMELLLIVALTVNQKKLPLWLIGGFAASILGCILLVRSPGEGVRLAAYGGIGGVSEILARMLDISGALMRFAAIPIAATLNFTAIGILRKGVAAVRIPLVRTAILFIGALAATYSMILAPYFPGRAWSVPLSLYAASLVSSCELAFAEMDLTYRLSICTFSVAALSILALFVGINGYSALSHTYALDCARREAISEAKQNGISEVWLESIAGSSRFDPYDEYGDLSADPDSWPNTAIAMYFGLDSVNRK